jgi:hypothetical protein
MWSRMPIPGGGYGHRCACDLTNDDHGDHPQVTRPNLDPPLSAVNIL